MISFFISSGFRTFDLIFGQYPSVRGSKRGAYGGKKKKKKVMQNIVVLRNEALFIIIYKVTQAC
jgi:hypothetical protein